MDFIIDALKKYVPAISELADDNTKMMQLAMDTYAIVEKEMESILASASNSWMSEKSNLVSLGGIMINIDGDAPDLFLPNKFQNFKNNGDVINMFDAHFAQEVEMIDESACDEACIRAQE